MCCYHYIIKEINKRDNKGEKKMGNTLTFLNTREAGRNESLFGTNPMIRRINRISERSADHVTFAGISNKCMYFMLILMIGIVSAMVILKNGNQMYLGSIDLDGFSVQLANISVMGSRVFAASALMLALVPILSIFMKKSAAVLGTVYCFSAGYFFSSLAYIIEEYREACTIALIITVAICVAMFLIYRSGMVTVTNKFRTVVLTLVLADIICALAVVACMFIPGLKSIADFAFANGGAAVVCSVVGVVMASLFLLVDFDGVTKAVENEIPYEYEWYCAFALAFSVIWLFMKVFELVLEVMAKNNKK